MPLMRRTPTTLRPEFSRLFDDLFADFPAFGVEAQTAFLPAVNVTEDEKAVNVRAELPGVDAKDIHASIEANVLTLRGEKREEKSEKKENYFRTERTFGSFLRRVPLPAEVDPHHAEAKLDAGVLTLRIPKIERAQGKAIPIQT